MNEDSMWIKYNMDVLRGDRVLHFVVVTPDDITKNIPTLAKL